MCESITVGLSLGLVLGLAAFGIGYFLHWLVHR